MVALTRNWIFLYLLLMAVLAGAAFVAGAEGFSHDTTRVVTKTLDAPGTVTRMSGAKLVEALGKPDKVQQQNGVTCGYWASKQIEVCW